jgi:hypothetical protein
MTRLQWKAVWVRKLSWEAAQRIPFRELQEA